MADARSLVCRWMHLCPLAVKYLCRQNIGCLLKEAFDKVAAHCGGDDNAGD